MGNVQVLFGDRKPQHEIQREKFIHRLAANLFARGASQREVAQQCEVTEVTVSNWVAQPWFQEVVLELMNDTSGKADIMTLFEAERINSLNTIVTIRDNEKISPATRLLAAKEILDRALGKPTQRVEHKDTTQVDDPVAETERLIGLNQELRNRL